MGPISRQDLQNMLDTNKNRILERSVCKADLQQVHDVLKNVQQQFQQNLQQLKQFEVELQQVARRDEMLESRLATVERDIKELKAEVFRLLDLKPLIMQTYNATQQPEPSVTYSTI